MKNAFFLSAKCCTNQDQKVDKRHKMRVPVGSCLFWWVHGDRKLCPRKNHVLRVCRSLGLAVCALNKRYVPTFAGVSKWCMSCWCVSWCCFVLTALCPNGILVGAMSRCYCIKSYCVLLVLNSDDVVSWWCWLVMMLWPGDVVAGWCCVLMVLWRDGAM
jgi:hypothetical protein